MYLIVGLGNPGKEYDGTPHNAGFRYLDMMYESLAHDNVHRVSDWTKDKYLDSEVATVSRNGEDVAMLMKPYTFMNRSGFSVQSAIKRLDEFNISEDLVIVHDDLDIEVGKYKLQRARGPKGHNGVNSVVNSIGSIDFLRVRIGVDNPQDKRREHMSGADYVLSKVSDEYTQSLDEAIVESVRAVRSMMGF